MSHYGFSYRAASLFAAALLIMLAMVPAMSYMTFADEEDTAESDEDIVYHVRPVKDGAYTVSQEKYNSYESEHFVIYWGDSNNSAITEAWLEGNLEILEGCWDVFINQMGMQSPALCTSSTGDHETYYKVNVVVMGTGISGYGDGWAYGGIDSEGYAYLMCCTAAMVYSPQTWVTPHEFGHVTQFAQGYNSWANGTYLGPWYEAIGNWYREQFLYSDYYTSGQYYSTDFSYLYLRAISLCAANGRAYYEAWPIFQYLTENPDNLDGYGSNFVAKLLQNGSSSGYIWEMIEDLADATLYDTLGYFAAHMATFDLAQQANYQAKIEENVSYGEFFWQQFYTMLEPVTGEENTYKVLTERAPQQAGYVITPLEIEGDEISVTLEGLNSSDYAAWSACIVLVKDGEATYSSLFGDGETMTVDASDADEAYLTVAAAPDIDSYVKFALGGEATTSFSEKPRYPYQVVMTGAVPQVRTIDTTGVSGHTHSNGGGFVADTAKVEDTVYVGPDAMVLGTAVVKGNVVITDHAVVMGSATIRGDAVIDGYAVVAGNASVKDNAHVGDYAIVAGSAKITDYAQVIESAYVYGSYSISEHAVAKGLALLLASGKMTGYAVADGDLYDDSGTTFSSGTAAGYLSLSESNYSVKLAKRAADGEILSYTFDEDEGYFTSDRASSTYALVHGAVWSESDGDAEGIYTFDGTSYLTVDPQVFYASESQIVMNFKWDGGFGQTLLYFEGSNGEYISFSPSGDSGSAELTIYDGTDTSVYSVGTITAGEWTEVIITISEGKLAVTVGGKNVICVEAAITPSSFAYEDGYVGCGADGSNGFVGSLDSITFNASNRKGVSLELVDNSTPADTDVTSGDATSGDATAAVTTDDNSGTTSSGDGNGTVIAIAVGITVTIVLVLVLVLVLTGKKKT
ncbi:MAG: DUF6055 domain-containing protein [Firmicutes bacterium]|nr:DUF6055 domain-containing protein [Bacillota bacterium]